MADFTTHHIFGQQVLAAAKPNIITCIEENLGAFCWGLQGPDLLYFHRAVVAGSQSHHSHDHNQNKSKDLFHGFVLLLLGCDSNYIHELYALCG